MTDNSGKHFQTDPPHVPINPGRGYKTGPPYVPIGGTPTDNSGQSGAVGGGVVDPLPPGHFDRTRGNPRAGRDKPNPVQAAFPHNVKRTPVGPNPHQKDHHNLIQLGYANYDIQTQFAHLDTNKRPGNQNPHGIVTDAASTVAQLFGVK